MLGAAGTTIRSVQNDGERIAVLESQVKDTHDELQRINRKLDQLLEPRYYSPMSDRTTGTSICRKADNSYPD